MEVLELNVKLCRLIGIFTNHSITERLYAFCMNIFLYYNLLFVTILTGMYSLQNLSNMKQMTYAFYILSAGFMGISQYTVLLINGNFLKKQINEVQNLVNSSEKAISKKYFISFHSTLIVSFRT